MDFLPIAAVTRGGFEHGLFRAAGSMQRKSPPPTPLRVGGGPNVAAAYRRLLGLGCRHMDDHAIKDLTRLNLTGQTAVGPRMVADSEHAVFKGRSRAGSLEPGLLKVHMACAAGHLTAALTDDPLNIIVHGAAHQAESGPNVHGARLARVRDVGDLDHRD